MRCAIASFLMTFFAFGTYGICQNGHPASPTSPHSSDPALITLYRTGRWSVPVETWVDGQEIAKLSDHKQVTFQVVPGYHEISAKLASLTPARAVLVEPGQQVYFALDWEHSGSGMKLSLDRVARVLDSGANEQVLSSTTLANILSRANPSGLDPANAKAEPRDTLRTLADMDVKEAVFQGMHDATTDNLGFALNDTEARLVGALTTDGGVSGYTVTVYSALAWIELQAAKAHLMLKPYSVEDVSPQMRLDVIRVIATPSTPGRLDAEGMAAASSAQHIVLADEERKNILQPLKEMTAGVRVDSALRSMEYGSVGALFTPDQVRSVQNPDGEFLIAVTGGYRKFFKVKKNTPIWAMLKQHSSDN